MFAAAAMLAAPAASAGAESGGAQYGKKPSLSTAQCSTSTTWDCRPNQKLLVKGHDLADVSAVDFLGGPGTSDDRRAKPRRTSFHRLTVLVPAGATTGPIRARTATAAARSKKPLRIEAPAALTPTLTPTQTDGIFPISGKHDMGQTATNGFGGGRGHQGQDLFATCGTPLVTPVDTTVTRTAYQSRAGNYLILENQAGQSYAYMHMNAPAAVSVGDTLTAGQQVGEVGQSGRASGCHLHFELWTAPGWQAGGNAINPLPQLKTWDQSPNAHN